ncbi:hypothetical protein J416_08082 [Gracilibacillus halophilus YIM-C55.5]|uniref:Uncharacterized protein n=1 Tax=Gracilibacillus halophilus YIM-C55.5 TaxID=1308866 RepID=N4W9H0_9BACI|nr:hypothetical protein [Gracilibacillus halophilus]ENH96928.1 hypothetical protein J416_08082 [Gracilibacillus halophilus YIM-C55.5]
MRMKWVLSSLSALAVLIWGIVAWLYFTQMNQDILLSRSHQAATIELESKSFDQPDERTETKVEETSDSSNIEQVAKAYTTGEAISIDTVLKELEIQ